MHRHPGHEPVRSHHRLRIIAPVGLWFFHIRSAARIDRVVTAALTPIIAAGFDAAAFIIGLASVPPRLIAFVVEYASNA